LEVIFIPEILIVVLKCGAKTLISEYPKGIDKLLI